MSPTKPRYRYSPPLLIGYFLTDFIARNISRDVKYLAYLLFKDSKLERWEAPLSQRWGSPLIQLVRAHFKNRLVSSPSELIDILFFSGTQMQSIYRLSVRTCREFPTQV